MTRIPIDLTQSITNDANSGRNILKGYMGSIDMTCGPVSTNYEVWVGESVPFDLLLGRLWQTENYVSIVKKSMETYLEFRSKENNNTQYEVCVSPAVREPSAEQKRKPFCHHPGPQTYTLTLPLSTKLNFDSDFNDIAGVAAFRTTKNLF